MSREPARQLSFTEIQVGDSVSFLHTLSAEAVAAFAELSGDYNPLHTDEAFAAESPFGRTIVHGMLTASLFSTLIGMYCPGERSLYVGQTLAFKVPVFKGERVT